MDISIDFTPMIQGFLDGIKRLVEDWVSSLPGIILGWLADQIMVIWNGIWDSGANMLATPFDLTIDFPPYTVLGHQLGIVAYSITALSVAVLGLRILWGNMSGRGGFLGDAVNGVLFSVFLAGTAALIVGQAFLFVGIASDAFGRLDYRPSFDPHTLLSIGPDLFLGAITLVVLLVYGWRLLVRGAYRTLLIGFLAPFAPVAGALWGIPQVRWVSVLYWVTFGGWLAGGFLAIGAVSLAVQLAIFSGAPALLKLVFGVALVQLAYDLMSILPRGATGGIQIGSPFGAVMSAIGMGAVAGGAAAAAGGASASGGTGASGGGSLGTSSAVGALPAGGEMAGYGY
jgi:hypothetical protein